MRQHQYFNWYSYFLPTERQYELASLLEDVSPSSEMLRVMGDVFAEQQTQITLLLEDWFWNAWPGLTSFSKDEQAILKYFYPLYSLLQTNAQKSHCLATVFDIPVRIQELEEQCRFDGSVHYLQEGQLFEERVFTCSLVKQFVVQIGPIHAIHLSDWMPSGQKRQFLSRGLLPLLLPPNRDVKIEILSNEHVAHESTVEIPVYWDQNFQPG